MSPFPLEELEGPSWEVAPLLLGAVLRTRLDGVETSVALTEVEAYDQADEASHSFRGQTPRTAAMFGPAGRLYVYRSYGLHWCVNVVTGPVGHGAAVLLRGGRPVTGEAVMATRRGRSDRLADGPGKLTQALGIDGSHGGLEVTGMDGPVSLLRGERVDASATTPRIGISRATDVPWRFVAAEE
jgi:DNA-3-methyladenine glycosylase